VMKSIILDVYNVLIFLAKKYIKTYLNYRKDFS